MAGSDTGPVPGPDVAPEVRELSRRLLPEADALGARMAERICAEIPMYAEGQLVAYEQLTASCGDNTRYVLGQLAGGPRARLDAPLATGATRAEQGVPYAAVLQAFRVGARFLWELLVERADPGDHDVLLLAAADIWAVSDELASQVTEAYRTAQSDRVRRDGQMRAVLVSGLLDGDVTAAEELDESAGMLHLQRSGEFAVVSAECPAPGAEALPDVEPVLRRHNVTSAWRLDHEHQDGLVELRLGFGAQHLVEVLTALTRGRVGMGAVFRGLADAPTPAARPVWRATPRRRRRETWSVSTSTRSPCSWPPSPTRPRPWPPPSSARSSPSHATIATCSCRRHAPG